MEIKTFDFAQSGKDKLNNISKGRNWPVVYLICDNENVYIGETTSAATRMQQHLDNPEKKDLKTIQIVFEDTFNKSVILDFEQKLIKCFKVDKKFTNIMNKNGGQSSMHDYYKRGEYHELYKTLWSKLLSKRMVKNSLEDIENQNIFKYSPYNSLTEEQEELSISILNDVIDKLNDNNTGVSLVNGCAGTGKTVLAISMINTLVNAVHYDENEMIEADVSSEKIELISKIKEYVNKHKALKIGFVFPMSGIRGTIADVFDDFGNGLSKEMVLSPVNLGDKEYDVLFVDESHRLSKRKNIMNFKNFDKMCKSLNLDKNTANQLDWVLLRSKYSVLFYDKDQSIKGADITYNEFEDSLDKSNKEINRYELTTQMRCKGGDSYIYYIKEIMKCNTDSFQEIENYDFKIFNDVDVMINEIKKLDEKYSLCRNVAGYSWKWISNPTKKSNKGIIKTVEDIKKHNLYDITIGDYKYIWNLSTSDWINREDSLETIGCIHTTQGFDLNYIGVIFGKEIDYNPKTNNIEINLKKFYDINVKKSCDYDTVKQYIINTYTTIMARGIKGCYVYACNKNLQEYLKKYIKGA